MIHRSTAAAAAALLIGLSAASAQDEETQRPERVTEGQLVMENIPDIPGEVRGRLIQYNNVRSAGFSDFAPDGGIYISTRFGETNQIHHVAEPMGMRKQLTFYDERVSGADPRPDGSNQFTFTRDVGGDEFYQGFLFDADTAEATRFTEEETRNQGLTWSPDGSEIAWASATWETPDYTLYAADPEDPDTRREILQGDGAMSPAEYSPDGEHLLVSRYISINKAELHLLDLDSGELTEINPDVDVAYGGAAFSADGESLFVVTDEDSEFRRIMRIDLESGDKDVVAEHDWDIQNMDLSEDGSTIAYTTNAGGISELYIIDAETGEAMETPDLPVGIVYGVTFNEAGDTIGFTHVSSSSPGDAWTYGLDSGELTRWTESEVGGLDTSQFAEPELIEYETFDERMIPAFVYRSEEDGPRPVIIDIHGGPEGQSRPGFSSVRQYWIDELGATVIVPNVRGSSGYGNEYVNLDNGMNREDSVRDIGALLDWVEDQDDMDSDQVVVYGGSYGGYMVLASSIHYSDRLAGAVNIVGISSFITFLENTAGYRQDLRRAEYGDERDPEMRAHFEQIDPIERADEIDIPLFVIHGANDPRVPASEAEQILDAVRSAGGDPWYLLAMDEGHGFAKQSNREFQREAETMFFRDVFGRD